MRALLCVVFLGGPVAFGLGHILPLPTALSASFEPTFEARASFESLADNPQSLWPVEHHFGHGDSLDRPQWGCPVAFHYGAMPQGFCDMATVSGFVGVSASEGHWRLSLRWRDGGAGLARLLDANGRTLADIQGADGALEARWPLEEPAQIGAATHIELILDAQPEHVYLGALMCLDESLEGDCETWLDDSDGEGAARVRLTTEPATKQLGLEWVHSFGSESRLLLLDDTGGVLQALDCLPAAGSVSLQPGVVNGLSAFRLETSSARFVEAVVSSDCQALEVARSGEGVAGAPVASSRGGAGKAGLARKGETLECPPHSADQDGNFSISLSELLRVIQFFNTGGYRCSPGTEDGYAPGAGAQDCAPHDSDYNPQDWEIRLTELLRLVQLFNVGAAEPCPEAGTEDGFCVDIGNLVLNGPAAVNIQCGEIFEDPGASIEAHCGGTFEAVVSITPEANLNAPLDTGQYLITYALPDNSGKQVTRSLSVADTIAPEVSFPANPMYFENTIFQDFEVTDEGCGGQVESALEFQNLDSQNPGNPPQVRVTATDASGNSVTTEWQDIEVRKPNILYINIDDLNDWVTHLQVFSREGANDFEALTPNLQRLAERSRVFKHAYSAAPISNPSRAAIMTGRHPMNSGLYWTGEWYRLRNEVPDASNREALIKYMGDVAGYDLYGAGKISHDGGLSYRRWHEWLFGANMNNPLAEVDDRYLRRPEEPEMMDAVTLPTIENMGFRPWWGTYHVAVAAHRAGDIVNPIEQQTARLQAGASPGTPGLYEIDLKNLSAVYGYTWSLCVVDANDPTRFCEIGPATTNGDFTVSHDFGALAPSDAPDAPSPDDTITVSVTNNREFQLVVVPGNNGSGPACPCISGETPNDPFNPSFVDFNGFSLEWDSPLSFGATSRQLHVRNNTGLPQLNLVLTWPAQDADVRVAGQAGSHTIPFLAAGGSTTVTVSWSQGGGISRWPDYDSDANVFPFDPTNRYPDFFIELQQNFRPKARVWNEFKAETPSPGQGLVISDALITNKVLDWLAPEALGAGPGEEPFLLAMGIYRPHNPLYAPREYFDRAGLSGPPAYWDTRPLGSDGPPPEPSPWGRALAMKNWMIKPFTETTMLEDYRDAYLANVAYADTQLGRVLDVVFENPYLAKSTIIVLWSDHGYHLGEQSHLMKSTLWERSNRVPLLVSIPGTWAETGDGSVVATQAAIPVGPGEAAVIDASVSLVDLYPTLIELGGAPLPDFLLEQRDALPEPETGRGISLLPLLFGETNVRSDQGDALDSVPVVSSFTRMPCGFPSDTPLDCDGPSEGTTDVPIHAVRDDAYRYIRYNALFNDTNNTGNELYNIDTDPLERSNIIGAADPALLTELHRPVNRAGLHPVWSDWNTNFTTAWSNLHRDRTIFNSLTWQAGWGESATVALDLANPDEATWFVVRGSVYYDKSRFAVREMRLPVAQANAGWRLSYQRQRGGSTVETFNFDMRGAAFAQASHPEIILVEIDCIDPAGCGGAEVKIMSNERTRITGRRLGKDADSKATSLPGATIPLEPFVYIAPPND